MRGADALHLAVAARSNITHFASLDKTPRVAAGQWLVGIECVPCRLGVMERSATSNRAPLKIPNMTTSKLDGVSVATQASVYFDGKCISHGVTFADGTKKSVGVILPATLTFNTGAPEIMECTGGACEYKLTGTDVWVKSIEGEQFSVPGNSKFEIRVAEGFAAYHYICHFG